MRTVSLTAGGLLLATLAAGQPMEPIESQQFLSANEDPAHNVVFRMPIEVDWEALAPPQIASIPEGQVPPELFDSLDRLAFYHVLTLSFDALLDPRLKHDFYYYVSPFGVVPLRLLKMRGEVILHLEAPQRAVGGRSYGGAVVAELMNAPWLPSDRPRNGGFVVRTSSEIPRQLLQASADSLAAFMETRVSVEGLSAETLFRTTVRQYQFRMSPGEDPYEFRQWAPDVGCIGMCCSSRYSIGIQGASRQFLATQLYDCDM